MKMCMHFKLIGKMGAGAEQEYTMDKEKKILNQIQPVSCPAPISLYFSAFLYISLHFSTFLCISLNVSAFRCISLHFSTFHFKRNLFHMKSSVGIYTLVLWLRIFLSDSKAFLYFLGLRGPLRLPLIPVVVVQIKKIKKKGAFFSDFASGRTHPTQSTGP